MVVAQEKFEWQEPFSKESAHQNPRTKKKRHRYAKSKSILMLACIVGLTGAIGAETIQLTVVQGAQVRSLQKDISAIQTQNDLLQLETDKLRAIGRIESVALSLGMVEPTGRVYVAETLPATVPTSQNQEGAPPTQVATQATETKPTALQQFSQIFTSFFASTQR